MTDWHIELDQSFSETVENVNKTESKALGKGRVEFFVKDCQGNSKKISMRYCFYVPENSENLVSVSNLTRGGANVVFREKSCIEPGIGTVYPLSERGNLFIWKIIGFGNHEKLSVEKMENKSSEFRVSKTYFCRETEEKNFSEQNKNMIGYRTMSRKSHVLSMEMGLFIHLVSEVIFSFGKK